MSEQNRISNFLNSESDSKHLAEALNDSLASTWAEIEGCCENNIPEFKKEANIMKEKFSSSFLTGNPGEDEINAERLELQKTGLLDPKNALYYGNLSVYCGDFVAASLAYGDIMKQDDFSEFCPLQKYLFSVVFSYYKVYDKTVSLLENDYSKLPPEVIPIALMRLAIALRYEKRLNASLKILLKLGNMEQTVIPPNYILLQLSEAYIEIGDYKNAVAVIKKSREHPIEFTVQICFAMLLSDKEKYIDNAILIAFNSPRLSYSSSLQYLVARLLWKRRSSSEAVSYFPTILKDNPKDEKHWCALGLIYTSYGQMNDAINAFKMAITINPNMIEAWANIGAILELDPSLGNPIEFYRKALRQTNSPLFFQTRIDILETGIDHKPTMVEPNDREYFESPGKIQARKFLTESQKIPIELIKSI